MYEIFNKTNELKAKFNSFFQHRKKLSALENFSTTGVFPQKKYLTLIRHCMNDGFLGEKEEEFLDHLLSKYALNYLDWAHKTPWLKKEMFRRLQTAPKPQIQPFFDFDKPRVPINVPIEILAIKSSLNKIRRA